MKPNPDVARRNIVGWKLIHKDSANYERANKISRSLKREEFLDPLCVYPYPIASCSTLCVSLHLCGGKYVADMRINILRTGDTDLCFYITTVQEG